MGDDGVTSGEDLVGGTAGSRDLAHDPCPVRIGPVIDQMEADQAIGLLAEQLRPYPIDAIPQPRRHDDRPFGPTLVGAWADDGLVGAALIGPGVKAAEGLVDVLGGTPASYHAAQVVLRYAAMVEGIAVRPDRRREGIGPEIKRWLDVFAAQHGAGLVLGIPVNEGSRRLNEKAGHKVLDPDVALVLQVHDRHGVPVAPPAGQNRSQSEGYSAWEFRPLARMRGAFIQVGQSHGYSIRVGQYPARPEDRADTQAATVGWYRLTAGGYAMETERLPWA